MSATDRAVGRALEDDRFLEEADALGELQTRLLGALDAAEGRGKEPRCIMATRAGGYLEGWYRIHHAVAVRTRDAATGSATRMDLVAVDVRLGFPQRDIVYIVEARIGSRILASQGLKRVLPRVVAWRPKVPDYWYALALLRESPPRGQCGTCLSEPYERCGCVQTAPDGAAP